MSTIVRRHYPAERLPEDLRPEGAAGALVEVTVRAEGDAAEDGSPERSIWPLKDDKSLEEIVAEFAARPKRTLEEVFASLSPGNKSAAEIDAELRAQRDEW